MAYSSNYYNYQIGVIFAILIAALLLLGAVVLGIYLLVQSMRSKKVPSRIPPTMSSVRHEWRPPPVTQQPQEYHQQHIQEPYGGRPYNPSAQSQYFTEGERIKELRPEYSYQVGPVTYTSTTPVTQAPNYIGPSGSYQMSSV